MVGRSVARLALAVLMAVAIGAGFAQESSAQSTGTVTVNAILSRTLTLVIVPNTTTFGPVSPGGAGGLTDPSTNNSYFLATGPIVAVITNSAWTGTIAGADAATPETSITVTGGALRYTQVTAAVTLPPVLPTLNLPTTFAAAAALAPITTAAQPWVTTGAAGVSNYAQVYALRVRTTDTITNAGVTGQFSATITYSASN